MNFHTQALFAGGFPGVAQNWPPEHAPAAGKREADLMALPLIDRLKKAGWSQEERDKWVKRQGESNNSIGDVVTSIEQGFLDPNDFHRGDEHGIHLVTGRLHGLRFRGILAKEYVGIGITRLVLKDVIPGDLESLREAEKRANSIVAKFSR